MQSFAAVAITITIVASRNNLHKPARRPAVGVVIEREHSSEAIDATRVRIPEARGNAFEVGPVEAAAVDVSTFASPGEGHSIGTDQFVIRSQVFSASEIEPSQRIESQSRQAVVGIIALCVETDNGIRPVGLVVAVVVVKQSNLAPRGDVNRVARRAAGTNSLQIGARRRIGSSVLVRPDRLDRDAHREFESVGKDDDLVGFPVAVGVIHHQHPVAGMPLVSLGTEMSVALDGPHAPLVVDVDPRRCDELRVLGEELDLEPRVERSRQRVLSSGSAHTGNRQRKAGCRCSRRLQVENLDHIPFFGEMCHLKTVRNLKSEVPYPNYR